MSDATLHHIIRWNVVFCKGIEHSSPSAVGVFTAQTAVVEHDIATIDVIPESPPAQSKAVLALSLSNAFQFPDAMLSAPVVWISAENR